MAGGAGSAIALSTVKLSQGQWRKLTYGLMSTTKITTRKATNDRRRLPDLSVQPKRTGLPAKPLPSYCENEVFVEGELCSEHDADARAEDDYDRYLQSKED